MFFPSLIFPVALAVSPGIGGRAFVVFFSFSSVYLFLVFFFLFFFFFFFPFFLFSNFLFFFVCFFRLGSFAWTWMLHLESEVGLFWFFFLLFLFISFFLIFFFFFDFMCIIFGFGSDQIGSDPLGTASGRMDDFERTVPEQMKVSSFFFLLFWLFLPLRNVI